MNIKLAAFCLLTPAFYAMAASECTPNLIKKDVCEIAANIAAEAKTTLPIRISEGIEMYSIEANKNALISYIRMKSTESEMQDIYTRGRVTPGLVKAKLREETKIKACESGNPIRSFINLGGEVHYNYTYPSGKTYDSFSIVYCKQ
ncbi:hypothetical protein PWJ72_01680 [Serratia nevei]|nr:hypothetical protein [Serratia nevei]